MYRRFAELETGKVKGHTLEEMEAGARESYKNRKRKNYDRYIPAAYSHKQVYDEAYEWYEDK